MPINSVALIAGALSFSAALAWNKAISDTLNSITKTNSTLLQAIVITIIIIIVVFIINISLDFYTRFTNISLNNNVIMAGGKDDSKVKLWNK